MKKLLISLIVITILSVTSKTYSDELIIPEVFLDYCTWYYTNIPDIHAASVIYGGAAKDFQTKAEFGWTLEKNINNIWTQITTYNFYEKAGPHINSWYGVDNLYYVGQAIAPHGNGNYRAKFFVKATSNQVVIDEYSVWRYATVNDIYAPATPSSYSGSWQSDHPFLNWSDNIEDDFKEYIVYKKVGSGSWNYLETTTSSQYTDYSESKYTAGSGEK